MSKNDGRRFLNIERLSELKLDAAEAKVVSQGRSFHPSRRPSSRRGSFEKLQSSVSVSAGLWERLRAPFVFGPVTLSGVSVDSVDEVSNLEILSI